MQQSRSIKYYVPLILLLIVDIVLIVLNVINFYHPFPDVDLYNIETNDSYAEDFQNFKWILMILGLLMISIFRKEKRYLAWVLVFFFLFLEDVFRIHGGLGHVFYDVFGMTSGRRGGKIMELFAAVFLGFLVLAPAAQAYKTGDALFRKHSKAMLVLLLLFLFCAIVLDQVHRLAVVSYHWKYNIVLGILEDGGELITESLLTGYLLSIALKQNVR
ncbi:hypothetical protein [Niabella terrae]